MKKILLIEDDIAVREVIVALLELEGYELRTATQASDGRLKLGQDCPDVVVLDLHLPDGEGTEFWLEIRALCPEARVIFSTGSADARELERARSLEADVLLKPYGVEELLRAIERNISAV